MASSQGFWSYVHDDDRADGERISRLAKDVMAQFQMLTGEMISLFLDRDTLTWGENWRDKTDESLSNIAFFIPVMTPRFFMSPECRRELQFFARQATELGIKELILPLLYVDFSALHDENTRDDLIKLVRTFQWEDWSELRFSDVASERYRRGVAKLAVRLVEANKHAEETAAVIIERIEGTPEESRDDSPGVVDLLGNSEEMLQKLPETLVAITQNINQIGQIMQEATDDIQRGDAQGKGFAARLIVARRTANRLSEPTEHIWSLGNVYASQLHSVDAGFRIIIERAPLEIKEDPDAKSNFCKFFEAVRSMSASSSGAIDSFQKMIDASEPLERMSRDLRPVLRRVKQGLTILIESAGVTKEWIHLIDATGIACEGTTA
jgi:hypothetical protein